MTREQLTKLVEDIAVDFVLIDPSDAEELTSVISRFKDILAWAGEQSQPVLETALTRMIHMASHELEKSSELSESVYDIMGSSISVIQKHARNDYDFSHALFPRELEDSSTLAPIGQNISTMINTDDQEAREPWIDKNDSPAGLRHPDALPSHLDMELFAEFLSLQTAILDKMETLILAIEQKHDQKAFAELKRMVHTQKGEAGFLALKDIERLCHGVEDLLESDPSGKHSEMLFSFVDWLRQAYSWYKGESREPPSVVDGLILALDQTSKEKSLPRISHDSEVNDDAGMSMDSFKPESDAQKKAGPLAVQSRVPTKSTGSHIKDSILVDTERLDRIIDMVGELVIAQSMVMQSHEIQTMASQELHRHLSQMDKITRGLQETSLSLRMVPIRSTFQKIARLVRDISKKSGKPIQCIIQGEETELDKTIVDKIGEPLLHIIRNALDHGIEGSSDQRLAKGKPAQGSLNIKAFHKSGNIHIEIEDDGRGLDKGSILKKAKDLKLVMDDVSLSERDIVNLIFEPGFSTASEITDLSGRGVGMSVVKTTIESLRGQVDVRSVEGKGSTFIIKIPLTLAIIDGMIVRTGENRFIIPTLSIITSSKIEPGSISTVVNKGKMVDVQGHLIPLFKLSSLLETHDSAQADSPLMVVVEGSNRRIALGVDELLGKQQIVIKSLGESLKNTPGISGAAIMPDGKVGLIVDIDKLTGNSHIN